MNKKTLLFVGISGLFISFFVLIFIFIQEKQQNQLLQKKLNDNQKLFLSLTPTPIINSNFSILDIDKQLSDIFNGIIIENNNSNTSNLNRIIYPYKEMVHRDSGRKYQIEIIVYKYVSGDIFTNGYEGMQWDINMDKWKQWLISLQNGKQSGIFIDNWGENTTNFEVKSFGKQKYAIRDYAFKPSATQQRTYITFDQQYDNIIEITTIFYRLDNNDRKKFKELSCYDDITEIIFSLEDVLNSY